MKKRVLVYLLLAAILVGLSLNGAQAASEIIFVSVGDEFLPVTEDTMPMRRGGQLYVPYTVFTKSLGIFSSYNKNEKILVLFNFDYTMTFDMNTGKTEDEKGVVFENPAVLHNGTAYVCVSDVVGKMGLYYAQLVDAEGTVIRLNKDRPALSNSEFISLGRLVMEVLANEYNRADTSQETDPDTPPAKRDTLLYLTFDGAPGESTSAILDALKETDIRATFFLTGGQIVDYGDVVRRMVSEGHAIGLCGMSGSADRMCSGAGTFSAEWEDANRLLDKVTMSRTRLICLPERAAKSRLSEELSSVLTKNGLRLWGYDVQVSGDTADRVLSSAKSAAGKAKNGAVLRLADNAATAEALPEILAYLERNDYKSAVAGEWMTPLGRK